MTSSPEILYKDKNIVLINKPVGMPSQPDLSTDGDALSCLARELEAIGESPKLWLVHRLDRTVGGLLVFARTKRAAAELCAAFAESKAEKIYLAVCHGKADDGEYRDYIFKDSAASKAFVVKSERRGAKEALLEAARLDSREETSLVRLSLRTGRFHQIRVQLASRGHSLVGDKKYGSRDAIARHPALFASELSFVLFGKEYRFHALPETASYPWNIYSEYWSK